MDLATAQRFWHGLQKKLGDFENAVRFANTAQAAGLDRGDLKWLSRLPHEPSLKELMAYQEWRPRLGHEPTQLEIDQHIHYHAVTEENPRG